MSYQVNSVGAELPVQQPAAPETKTTQDTETAQAAVVTQNAKAPAQDLFDEEEFLKEEDEERAPRIDISKRIASIFGTVKSSIKELFTDKEDETLN
jgi:hypothetical protein